MNEEIKQKLITYLQHLESAVTSTGDFVAEQAPLVVQEYVLYSRVYSTIPVVIALVMLCTVILNVRWFIRTELRPNHETQIIIRGVVSIMMFMAMPVIAAHNLDRCIKSWCAPRILVIDYIKEQIGKGN